MKKQTTQDEHHKFDNTLKNLFGDEAKAIIPHLIKNIEVLDEQNVEIDRTRLRADLVEKVLYEGEPHILNMELQVKPESKLIQRVLLYCTSLHHKHGLPVISVILYPFEIKPPFHLMICRQVVDAGCGLILIPSVCGILRHPTL